ncbi:MAG: DUF4265 domain-containing protein [Bacteroidota bacterium]
MAETKDKHVKVLFRFFSDLLDEWTVETMWTEIIDKEKGIYKLDSIPFYAKSLALSDIIFAEYDEDEQFLTYRETIEYSGNSTIQVVVLDNSKETNFIRDIFTQLGCSSEKFKEGYFVIDIPAKTDYLRIKQKLKELSDKKIIDFAESCLSENHRH